MQIRELSAVIKDLYKAQVSPFDLDNIQISQKIRNQYELGPEDLGIVKATLTARDKLNTCEDYSHFICTPQALEQASSLALAKYHAEHFSENDNVLEIGSGAGFDSFEIIKNANSIVALEIDQRTAECTEHNLSKHRLKSKVVATDALNYCRENNLSVFNALWADPSRRDKNGKRILNPSHYSPSLDFLIDLPIAKKGIKISSIADVNLPTGWIREWIGFDKECKEQLLWFGSNKESDRVVVVENKMRHIWNIDQSKVEYDLETLPEDGNLEGYWLLEPHAAVLATRKERAFLSAYSAKCFEDEVIYGVTKTNPLASSFYSRFKISSWFPYNKKVLRGKLHELRWGSNTEIKKRNFPFDLDDVRKVLKLSPSPESSAKRVIFLTRYKKMPIAILGERVP